MTSQEVEGRAEEKDAEAGGKSAEGIAKSATPSRSGEMAGSSESPSNSESAGPLSIELSEGRFHDSDLAFFVPPGGPPQVERPSPEVFLAMGEAGIERMLGDFYAELEGSSIRHLFPRNMQRASLKSAAFFIGLLGGPPRYQERFGPPRMRERHMPFAIDESARQEWLRCFDVVLERAEDYGFPSEHLPVFRDFLDGFSLWMVNRA